MPLPERDNNRTIATDRNLPEIRTVTQTRTQGELPATSYTTERDVAPIRLPIEARTVNTLSDYPTAITYDRTLPDLRQAISPRTIQGRSIDSTQPVSKTSVAESLPLGQTIANYYSGGGSGGGRSYDNPISVVPGGNLESGNSNLGLIFIVIVVAGGIGYWYYKKGGFQ